MRHDGTKVDFHVPTLEEAGEIRNTTDLGLQFMKQQASTSQHILMVQDYFLHDSPHRARLLSPT